jgi:pimeloyl-ACP methyl ester carboxylesterase
VRASGKIVDDWFGYKATIKFLDRLPRKVAYYGYDWRKSPLRAVPALDEKIDELLESAGADKVVLMAHSMGGLVARAYVKAHPSKVDRVVTIGTPYLGAPKTWLSLSRGRTSPEWNRLDDWFISPGELRFFSRTATGAFFLYPSKRYIELVGPWLSVPGVADGQPLEAQQVLAAVRLYNGNPALLQEAYDSHSSLLEVFPEGEIDWQMVVGSGVKTLMTIDEPADRKKAPRYGFGNGDGTVPYQSAGMGDVAPSAVHYVCGIAHGTLPGDKKVTKMLVGFLLDGDPIQGDPAPCSVP